MRALASLTSSAYVFGVIASDRAYPRAGPDAEGNEGRIATSGGRRGRRLRARRPDAVAERDDESRDDRDAARGRRAARDGRRRSGGADRPRVRERPADDEAAHGHERVRVALAG